MGTSETIEMFIKIVVFLPFIIFLIYLLLKYGGTKLQAIQDGRYMKVVDRLSLSKENSLLVIKIGEKGYVVSSVQGRIEIHMEIPQEELANIETTKTIPQYESIKDLITKLKRGKEDKL
jgi:flagellar protein FliO/FliZ